MNNILKTIYSKLISPSFVSPPVLAENSTLTKFEGLVSPGASSGGVHSQVESRLNSVTTKKLKSISNSDPTIWAIKKTRRDQVTQTKWDIIADLDQHFSDLERWESVAKRNLNPYGITLHFKPTFLDPAIVSTVQTELKSRVSKNLSTFESHAQIKFLFETIRQQLKQEAAIHRLTVKNLLSRPNRLQSSFEALLKVIIDDILVYDSGVIIKNKNNAGTDLVELYTIPGEEVKILRNKDGSFPKNSEAAYLWSPPKTPLRDAVSFNNDELLYIVDNPQHTGYGISPLEISLFIITASLYAENYNLDFLRHTNIPPGVLNLGANVSKDKVQAFQKMWDAEVNAKGGLHKLIFAAGSDSMKLIPLKQLTNKDMQLMEYLKWTLSLKCMAYQISPQDLGFTQDFHRTTSEVQKELSKTRGLKNLLSLLQAYINQEIVKSSWTFNDVKFKWLDVDLEDTAEQSKIDTLDLRNGVISLNERRQNRGDGRPIEGGDDHYVYTGTGRGESIESQYKLAQKELESESSKEKDLEEKEKLKEDEKNKQEDEKKKQEDEKKKQEGKKKETSTTKIDVTKKVNSYDIHNDSCSVNSGILIHTLETFQQAVDEILETGE